MFEYKTNEDQQNKIYARYLEFCNLRRIHIERIKFSYYYKKNTMRVEAKNYDKRIVLDTLFEYQIPLAKTDTFLNQRSFMPFLVVIK